MESTKQAMEAAKEKVRDTATSAMGLESEMKDQPIEAKLETEYGFKEWTGSAKLHGMKAIITGGDSGIGLATAILFAAEGADVAIVYRSDEQGHAHWAKNRIKELGRECCLIPCDISEKAAVDTMINTAVACFGTIDILVNNAAVMYVEKTLNDVTPEEFDRTIKTNIYGTYYVTRAALKHMKECSSIIVSSCHVAYTGASDKIDYSTTKAAMLGFVRSLSQNLLDRKIRVNAVCPGPVSTPLTEAGMDQSTLEAWHKTATPLGRVGQPAEIAPAFLYLASNEMSSFVTGQSLHVNGGTIVNG